MKDLHSHLLYGIDDGCTTLTESISLLKKMEERGITDLVITPHYIVDTNYTCEVETKTMLFNRLKKVMEDENINMKVYLGNEIFLDDELVTLLKNKKIQALNNSKYLLIEFPVINFPTKAKNIFSELIYEGYTIILAHPERYMYVAKDIKILDDFKQMGVLFQGNYESLYGKYGKAAEKTLKKLLKKGYISFLAGDIHHEVTLDIKDLEKKLKKYLPSEEITKVLETNFDCVINNISI